MLKPIRNNAGRQQVSSGPSIKPPVGGWDAASPLASMPDDRAPVLDNWIPRQGYIEVRRGYRSYATGMTGAVESLLVYEGLNSSSSKLFAVADSTIYDATSAATVTSTGVSGLASNRWQSVNFSTTGGKYLVCCSGLDGVRNYDGSSWTTPTITGVDTTSISHVNAHKNRLWFVLAGSTQAAYLPTGTIAGAATTFELGGLFTKGGTLVAMATWTKDGGDGEDDLAAFISSRGQVAIYAGTDPSSVSTWGLAGVFDLGAPIGSRCFTKVAGDIALLNIDGVLPLSKSLQTDRGAVSRVAITSNINRAMNAAAREYKSNFGWELVAYPKGTLAILNVPIEENATQHQYVMNTLSGAWCRWTGMNANCWAVFRDNLYFGGNDGTVYRADVGGLDNLEPIDAVGQTAYNYFSSRGILKDFKLIRPLVTTDSDVSPAIGLSTDFKDNARLNSPSLASTTQSLFDGAVWDSDVFPVESRNVAEWATVQGLGHCASVHFRARIGQATSNSNQDGPAPYLAIWGSDEWGTDVWSGSNPGSTSATTDPGEVIVQINGFDMIYERGGYM